MTRREQKKFVRELSENIRRDIEGFITSGKVPAEWNGWQLRMLLAERSAMCVYTRDDGGRMLREVKNTMLVNGM